ncbi:MAG: DUF4838 domain-containing protein [Oscillochloridaceae bacterium]|nr:DUF4838 domain-containing protein [Chloroflexaceae bacterium]MDW8391798.1 DUF4838 domain-containing protein [Oscillochloridaceae bacterium]
MSVAPTLDPAWSIELASDDPTALLAAEELRATLARIGAPVLPITAAAQGPRILLSHGPTGEGFIRVPDEHGLSLRGAGPRGLLYAVYDLLEALGCRWPAPEPGAEHLPRQARITLPAVAVADRPGLARRGLIIGHDLFLAQAEQWIIWAARNRLNTIFIHTTIRAPALWACRLAAWRERRAVLLPLLRQRGMRVELGGHHLRDLLPRRLFGACPEMFRHNGRRRTADHNLCVSTPAALAHAQELAAAFFAAYPEAEIYHLWPDDLRAGGWCHCPNCASLGPADQALIAANALAEALPTGRPGARVAFLAYHDTETPPAATRPHPRVTTIFAPRRRSYAEGMGASANAGVAGRLARYAEEIAGEELTIFEYYLDGILFKSSPPPLPEVIAADMRHYQATGASGVHVLLTGDRPFVATPPSAYLFARLAWAPTASAEDTLAGYAAARAPRASEALVEAYRALSRAWRAVLERDPEKDEGAQAHRGRDPIAHPPADVLDQIIAGPRRAIERRLEHIRCADEELQRAAGMWNAALAGADLDAERAEWELSAALLHFLHLRQQLYVLAARDAGTALLGETLAEAQAALDTLLAWADVHVPPAALGGHRLLRAAFQLHLDHIADARLLGPLARLGLRLRRAVAAARYAARLDWR